MPTEDLVATIRADISGFQASMRQMQTSVQQASQQSQQHLGQLDRSLKTLNTTTGTLSQTLRGLQALLVTGALAKFVQDATQASVRMTALETSFKTLLGTAQQAKTELDFVRQTAERLGLNFVESAEQMRTLIAAARNTMLEGKPMRELFEAITAASRGMGLSAERTGRIFAALTKIISTGTLQGDELRGMLAESLPGGFQIAARAMGTTTTALSKMMEQGQVLSTEFIPKLTRQLSKELGGAAEAGSKSYQAAMDRMRNATEAFSVAFGDMITKNPRVIQAINDIAESIRGLATTLQALGPIAIEAFAKLAEGAAATAQGVRQLFGLSSRGLLLELNIVAEAIKKQQALVDELQATAQDPTQRTLWQLRNLGSVTTLDQQLEAANKTLEEQIKRRAQLNEALMPPALPPLTVTAPRDVGREVQLEKWRAQLAEITKEGTAARERIAQIKELLAAGQRGDLVISPTEVQLLNNELTEAEKKLKNLLDPADKAAQAIERMATAGDLKNKITQLQAWIAAQKGNTEAVAVAVAKLEELQQKYNELALSALPNSVKEYQLLNQQLDLTTTKFNAVKDSLSPTEFALATQEITKQKNEMEDLALSVLPQSAQEYRTLAREVAQAEDQLATFRAQMTPTEIEHQAASIQQMHAKLRDLARTGLPESVKELERLDEALAEATIRFLRFKDSLSPEQLKAAQEELAALREHAVRVSEGSLAPDVRTLRETTQELARMREQLATATDPAEVRLLEKHIAGLENTVNTLGKTLNQVLVEKGLIPAGQAMAAFGDEIDGSQASVREFIDQQHELREIMALTPEEARKEMARYTAELKKSGATAEELQQVLFEQTRDQLQKTRQVIDDVTSATSDFLFDFATALTDSSKDVEDVWKDTLKSLQAMFLRTLTDMAAKALVSKITIPVSLGGTGAGATTTGGIDLSALLKLVGLGGTGTTTGTSVPGATVTGTGAIGGELPFGSVSTGAGGATAVGAGATATSGISTSSAASGVGAGLAAGTFTSSLFTQAGWSGTGANVAAGAIGGAVAGTMIAPGIGTAIGAALGALIPALMDPATRELVTGHWPGVRHLAGFRAFQEGNIAEGFLSMMAMGVPKSILDAMKFFGEEDLDRRFAAVLTTAGARAGFFEGAGQRGPFGMVGIPGRLDVPSGVSGMQFAEMFREMDEAIATHLTQRQKELATAALQQQREGLVIGFNVFDNEIFDLVKDRMGTILEGLARSAGVRGGELAQLEASVFANIRRDDKNLEQLEQAFAQAAAFFEQLHTLTAPTMSEAEKALAALNQQFDVLAEQATQYGVGIQLIEEARKREVIQFFEDIVKNLRIQQENLMRSIAGARQFVEEATMTPAVIFQRRQEELQALQTEFMAATGARQIAMAPELLQRIQQLMQLSMSPDVLGQDREMVLRLRQDLLSFIDDIEQMAGQDAFDRQISQAKEQITAIKSLETVTDEQLTEANLTLRRIESFLIKSQAPFVGEFQSGGRVPTTGFALVHRGETVLAPGQATEVHMPVNISINVPPGGMTRQQAVQQAEQLWAILEDQARRRQIPLKLADNR